MGPPLHHENMLGVIIGICFALVTFVASIVLLAYLKPWEKGWQEKLRVSEEALPQRSEWPEDGDVKDYSPKKRSNESFL